MISMITTSFNSEPFIPSCVQSILRQTYGDFEWIIVDDGSSDLTRDKIKKLTDPRIHLISAPRIGRGKALNIALRESQGSLVAIQDADDLSHPHRLSIQREVMERHPEIEVLGAEAILIGDKRDSPPWDHVSLNEALPEIRDVTAALAYYNPLPHSGLMIRRQTLLNVNGYNEQRKNLYDLDLYVRLLERGCRFYRLSMPLLAKRIHPHQFFEKRDRLAYIWEGFLLEGKAIRCLHLNPLFYLALPVLMSYRCFPHNLRMGVRKVFTTRTS